MISFKYATFPSGEVNYKRWISENGRFSIAQYHYIMPKGGWGGITPTKLEEPYYVGYELPMGDRITPEDAPLQTYKQVVEHLNQYHEENPR